MYVIIREIAAVAELDAGDLEGVETIDLADFSEETKEERNIDESESNDLFGTEWGTYTVKGGETLMWISFLVYGDYLKWRDLSSWNRGKYGDDYQLTRGTIITYKKLKNPFLYRPQGLPYLIKKRDTLGKISKKVYGKKWFWKRIWRNNLRQIKNPDLIFAGFTLYYPQIKS